MAVTSHENALLSDGSTNDLLKLKTLSYKNSVELSNNMLEFEMNLGKLLELLFVSHPTAVGKLKTIQ